MNLWKFTAIASLVISGSAFAQYTGPAVTDGGNSELSATAGLANDAVAAHGSEVPSFGPNAGNNSEHVAIYQGGSSGSGHGGHGGWDDKGGSGYSSGNNLANVEQDGAKGSSTLIYQEGGSNSLSTLQTAKDSLLYIRQSGGKNNTIGTGAFAAKGGSGSSGNTFTQSGSDNRMVINQDQSDNHIYSPGQSGSHNTAVIYQKGKNDLTANLSGNNNEAYISQNGQSNGATVTQSGSFNDLNLKQKGNFNTANLTQTGGGFYDGKNDRSGGGSSHSYGGNTLDVTQLGYKNDATVNQNGSSNTITLAQNSTNGIATIDQSGGTSRNTVTATSNVNNGLVDVDQTSGTKDSDVVINQSGGSSWDKSFDDDKHGGGYGTLVAAAKVLQTSASGSSVNINQSVAGISTTAYVQQTGSGNTAIVNQH
ncbi:hypothetical protein MXL54_04420 [Enterobacteriaceae bacterium G50]|nr:hypothetical protein [Enterobacteriaceae bacterium G50]